MQSFGVVRTGQNTFVEPQEEELDMAAAQKEIDAIRAYGQQTIDTLSQQVAKPQQDARAQIAEVQQSAAARIDQAQGELERWSLGQQQRVNRAEQDLAQVQARIAEATDRRRLEHATMLGQIDDQIAQYEVTLAHAKVRAQNPTARGQFPGLPGPPAPFGR